MAGTYNIFLYFKYEETYSSLLRIKQVEDRFFDRSPCLTSHLVGQDEIRSK